MVFFCSKQCLELYMKLSQLKFELWKIQSDSPLIFSIELSLQKPQTKKSRRWLWQSRSVVPWDFSPPLVANSNFHRLTSTLNHIIFSITSLFLSLGISATIKFVSLSRSWCITFEWTENSFSEIFNKKKSIEQNKLYSTWELS